MSYETLPSSFIPATRSIGKYSIISTKSIIVSIVLMTSLAVNMALVAKVIPMQEEITGLREEVKVLREYKETCGFNGVKKMFKTYVSAPVEEAYNAVKEKVGG